MQPRTSKGMTLTLALLLLTALPLAAQQTQTTEVKSFEVVSVVGNNLVLKGVDGAKEFTVPEDFRFTVDGKRVSVHELKPGMKGSATITTTETLKPVFVTEVKSGQVMSKSGSTVIVRTEDGIRMFSPGELEKRGIRIFRDGKVVDLVNLHEGDRLTATIVTEGPPQRMTEQEVQATITKLPPAAGAAAAQATGSGASAGGSGAASAQPAGSGASAGGSGAASAPATGSGASTGGSGVSSAPAAGSGASAGDSGVAGGSPAASPSGAAPVATDTVGSTAGASSSSWLMWAGAAVLLVLVVLLIVRSTRTA